jgi:bifunctional DNA-binding transcriptional regulator/antitoxin component of YhaV-PrlF toxin-antitoxin module
MSQLNYEELTKGLTTKSEKIRTLGRKGVPTADIARFLEIRYQHARNVLVDAGLQHGGMAEDMPVLETKMMPPGKNENGPVQPDHFWADVNADGTITIPANIARQAGFEAGDSVYVGFKSDGLEAISYATSVKRVQAMFAHLRSPTGSVVDEFLQERRRDAAARDAKLDAMIDGWTAKK